MSHKRALSKLQTFSVLGVGNDCDIQMLRGDYVTVVSFNGNFSLMKIKLKA